MQQIQQLLTEHLDIWTAAEPEKKSGRGRSGGNTGKGYGIQKLRGLILDLAVRGKLVPQDSNDEPASELLKRIQVEKANLIAEGKLKKEKPLEAIAEGEKLFDLPKGWEWVRNCQVFQLRKGRIPKSLNEDGLGLPYLDIDALDRNILRRYSEELTCPQSTDKDILVVCDGSRSGLVLDGKKGIVGSTLSIIDTPIYIQNYIKLIFKQGFEIFNTSMKGAAIPHLDTQKLLQNLTALPPIEEQQRIVSKVDELMALCDQLEQRNSNAAEAHENLVEHLLATLSQTQKAQDFNSQWQRIYANFDALFTTDVSIEALKKTLLQLAVTGRLVPQDDSDEPASELIKQILVTRDNLIKNDGLKTVAKEKIDEKEMYLNVPSSWTYCRLGNLAKFIDYRGRTPNKVNSGVPLITAKNVRPGCISRIPEEYITLEEYNLWMTRGLPRIGDMLFTTEAPLGNIALVDISEKFALAQRVICFQLHNQAIGGYLKVALMSQALQFQFEKEAKGMTATGIKASNLKEIPIPIPPLDEQHRIVAKVDELMALCDQLKAMIQEASQHQQQLADVLVLKALN